RRPRLVRRGQNDDKREFLLAKMEAGETMRRKIAMAAAGLLLAALATAAQEKAAYSIAAAQSKLEIHVGKEGAFKAFSHDHLIAAKEISGEAQFDAQKIEASSVRLQIATK